MEKVQEKTLFAPIMASVKQRRLAEEMLKIENQKLNRRDLLRKVGYSPLTAIHKQSEIFNSEGLTFALIEQGVTPTRLLKPACEALEATQATWYQGKLYTDSAPDYNIRLKGAEFIAEVMGLKKSIVEQRGVQVNIDASEIAHLFA